MAYSFSAASWQDDTCKLGQAATYGQASYDAYIKKAHDTRIGFTGFMVLFYLVAFGISNFICAKLYSTSGGMALAALQQSCF